METKLVRVSFDLELAKKITNGEVEGEIIDNHNDHYRLICFNFLDSTGQIIGLRKDKNYKETIFIFNENGYSQWGNNFNLFLKVPEYLTFKDGDIVALGWKNGGRNYCSWVSVIKKIESKDSYINTTRYVSLILENSNFRLENLSPKFDDYATKSTWIRRATEEEKQKLIEALKRSDDPKAKEYLKRFFGINIPKDSNSSQIEKNYEFKPFDKVLVRDDDGEKWDINLFKRYVEGEKFPYMCFDECFKQCIPYNEETAYLLDTYEDFNLWVI